MAGLTLINAVSAASSWGPPRAHIRQPARCSWRDIRSNGLRFNAPLGSSKLDATAPLLTVRGEYESARTTCKQPLATNKDSCGIQCSKSSDPAERSIGGPTLPRALMIARPIDASVPYGDTRNAPAAWRVSSAGVWWVLMGSPAGATRTVRTMSVHHGDTLQRFMSRYTSSVYHSTDDQLKTQAHRLRQLPRILAVSRHQRCQSTCRRVKRSECE